MARMTNSSYKLVGRDMSHRAETGTKRVGNGRLSIKGFAMSQDDRSTRLVHLPVFGQSLGAYLHGII
jgi:hypothetical protein